MKTNVLLLVSVAFAAGMLLCGEPDDGGKKGPPEGKPKLETRNPKPGEPEARNPKRGALPALEKQITFEFVETPLKEVIEFLSQVSQTPMVLDPKLGERRGIPVSLKGKDMPLEQVLSWIAKLAQLKWEIHENGVFIFDPKEGKGRGDEPRQMTIPKLSVKLPDGTVIEADAPLLMMPGMGQQILDRAMDESKDGLLAYRFDRDIPPDVDIEKLKALLTQTVPNVKVASEQALKVLVLTSDQPADLRRAAALMRAFRSQQPPRPGGPPGEEGFMVRRKPPFPGEGKPPFPGEGKGEREPQKPPGEF
jgi:hypothetical protein